VKAFLIVVNSFLVTVLQFNTVAASDVDYGALNILGSMDCKISLGSSV
jgi:hypothetical protein